MVEHTQNFVAYKPVFFAGTFSKKSFTMRSRNLCQRPFQKHHPIAGNNVAAWRLTLVTTSDWQMVPSWMTLCTHTKKARQNRFCLVSYNKFCLCHIKSNQSSSQCHRFEQFKDGHRRHGKIICPQKAWKLYPVEIPCKSNMAQPKCCTDILIFSTKQSPTHLWQSKNLSLDLVTQRP